MNLTEIIKNMFKQENVVKSMPMEMAKPIEGTKVRFWTRCTMAPASAKTKIENSNTGEYKNGKFVVGQETWNDSEIFSWTKIQEP